MKKVFLYVGSNNETKLLEVEKIEGIINSYFDGFSLYEIIGYWKREKEQTAKIELIITDDEEIKIIRLAKELKRKLKQDAILVEIYPTNAVFV